MSSYDIEDRRTDTVILWYNKHDLPWEHSFCGEPVVPGGHWHTYTVDPALSIAWQPAPLPQPFVRQSEGNFFISPGLKKKKCCKFFCVLFWIFCFCQMAVSSCEWSHIARMDFPRDIRSGNSIWRPDRSAVGRARVFRTRHFCKGPIAVGLARTRTACQGHPYIQEDRDTRNRRQYLCTGCSVHKGSMRTYPPFL